LRDAHSFFLARSFAMKDTDIFYIANSASDQISKFLGLVTSPAISGAATYGAMPPGASLCGGKRQLTGGFDRNAYLSLPL
jgi:hypothetical protein